MYSFSSEAKQRILAGKPVRAYMKFPATDTKEELIIDENNYLKDITFSDDRYAPDEGFIGQAVAKEVTGNFYNVDTDFNIQDREFELFVGVDLADGTTEYVSYGTYIVQKPENDTKTDNTSFTALDYMVKFNQTYVDQVTYPCTISTLLIDICNQAGVALGTDSFLNEDFEIEDNQFEPGTTLRDVLKAIAQVAFNWARINTSNELVIDFNKDTTSIETLNTNQFFELSTQNKYGPLNTIILRNSQVEGENYTITDDESVVANGATELVISDNPFAYTQEKRKELIEAGRNLFGLNYIPLTIKNIGYIYLDCIDKLKVTDLANKTYETYVLNHDFTYNGVISEDIIEADAETRTETKYQFTSELEKLYQHTEVVVDKAKQEITSTIEKTTVSQSEYSEFKQTLSGWQATVYTKDETDKKIQNQIDVSIEGITNTLTNAGGVNVFYYSTDYWNAIDDTTATCLKKEQNDQIRQNTESGLGYTLNKGVSEQKQNVQNGTYLITFKFYKLLTLSKNYIYINNEEHELVVDNVNKWTEFSFSVDVTTYSIDIRFKSDNDLSGYLADLMVHYGDEKVAWSQNANETLTDTVTIGKGIQVDSSESNTYTRIDTDGNRTYNKSTDEIVAEMTDKGVYSKELEVVGQAKIGNLLIQTFDSHVWITGIGG